MTDEPLQGMERRMVHRLLRHWRDAREGDSLPTLDAVYEQRLGDIVAQSFVVRIVANDAEPILGRIGAAFTDELAGPLSGEPLSSVPDATLMAMALGFYREVLKRRVLITRGDLFLHRSGDIWLYRSVIVPASADGRSVHFLLCAANGKVVSDDGGTG